MAVEFAVLGDIEVRLEGRRVEVGHTRQRCVLVALLVDVNRPVPVDRLVDRVWDTRPPPRALATLYSYLSRLRRILEPADEVEIRRRPGGYVLTADAMAVDLHRFQHLVGRARAAQHPAHAHALFDEALALWRGDAFAELDTPWCNSVRDILDVERLAAELDDNDLVLERGGHAELLGRLSSRAAAQPLDERVAAQLLLALYRTGRQADALEHFQSIRLRLAEELGVDPNPTLERLHRRILLGDAALAVPSDPADQSPSRPPTAPRPSTSQPAAPRPSTSQSTAQQAPIPLATIAAMPAARQLPAPLPSLTGRDAELAHLDALMAASSERRDPPVVATICGAGGMGKTCLALRWAHDTLDRFPDGQLYADLRGFDPSGDPVAPGAVLHTFLEALGVAPEHIPVDTDARACLYRSIVADRRMLVLLDDVRDTDQVAPLLPGTSATAVLITSRHHLAGLVTAHGARQLTLEVLTEVMARELLVRHLGAQRVAAEPHAMASLLEHCAGLPLALRIVAARAAANPDFPLAVLADEMGTAATRLDALDAGELAVNVRTVLSCSYQALSAAAAQVFRMLGLVPGPDIGLSAVAALSGRDPPHVRCLLRQLTNVHIVHEFVPGRYRMHDLVRLYATDRAEAHMASDERRAALRRLLDHHLHTAYAADRLLDPQRDPIVLDPPVAGVRPDLPSDHAQAQAWFAAEHATLLAAIGRAAEEGFDRCTWELAWTVATYCELQGHWQDQIETQRAALGAARRMSDRPAQAHAHRGLALALIWIERYDDARAHLCAALDLFAALGDRIGQAQSHRSLARVSARRGCHDEALPHDRQALALYRAAGHRRGQANALNAVGWHHAHLGRPRDALRYCEQALALHRELGDRLGMAATWDSLGYAHHRRGAHEQAVRCYRQSLALFRAVHHRYEQAETLARLGDTHGSAGHHRAAREAWNEALTIFVDLGHPAADHLRARLDAGDVAARQHLDVALRGAGAP